MFLKIYIYLLIDVNCSLKLYSLNLLCMENFHNSQNAFYPFLERIFMY